MSQRVPHIPYELAVGQVRDYAIFTMDLEGRNTSWNEGVLNVLGWTEPEWLDRTIYDIFPADEHAAADLELATARAKGCADDDRWQLRKDGTLFFANGITTALRGEGGALVGFMKVMRDKTEQKRHEEEVRQLAKALESERARMIGAIQGAPMLMATLEGPRHVITMANARYYQLIGRGPEVIGKTVREAIPEVEGQGFLELLDEVYRTGTPYVGNEMLFQSMRGGSGAPLERLFVNFIYAPLRAGDGKVVGIFVLGVDVTELVEAREAAKEREERLRKLADAMPQIVWTTGADGEVDYVNARWSEYTGLSIDALRSLGWKDFLHPEDAERCHATWLDAFANARPWELDYRLRNNRGEYRWQLGRSVPVRDEKGKVERWFGTATDIEEIRRAQDAAEVASGRFRFLAESMPQKIFTATASGDVDYFNRQWMEFTGLSFEAIRDWGWTQFIHPDDLERNVQLWKGAVESGEPFYCEHRFRRADGEYRWHVSRAHPMRGDDGRVLMWIGSNTEVHDMKQLADERAALLEAERAARDDAERASRLKDEFLATLSHELRTPLNAILGWSQILRRGRMDDVHAVEEGLDVIERNARIQVQLIADLLDMSTIISGKVRINVQRVSLPEVVDAAMASARPSAEAKGIRLQTVLDPEAGPVSGDPDRLQQVLWNLVSNAIKFTPKGGRITVTLSRVNSHLELSVSDTGKGIPRGFLPFVFDRFRQADASTTRVHGGLGLGLSIVKSLVELHGGTVEVESPGEGQGTTFTVSVPLAPLVARDVDEARVNPARESRPPPDGDCERIDGVKVLVVDDEQDGRELVKRLLEQCGAEVTTAGSSGEALVVLERLKPDVLLTDIGMPHEDGYELLRKVRDLPTSHGGGVPAAALTAFARSEDRTRAIRSGFQIHISKPVEPRELVAVVANLAGRSGPR